MKKAIITIIIMSAIVFISYPYVMALGAEEVDIRTEKQILADEWAFLSDREQAQKEKVDAAQKVMREETRTLELYQKESNVSFMKILKSNEKYATN